MYLAAATAPGSTHINPGQPGKINSQDVYCQLAVPGGHIVVLCDGCGSQPFSGTGADIAAHVIAHAVSQELSRVATIHDLDWSLITDDVLRTLRRAARVFALNGSAPALEQAVVSRFLFTALVIVVVDNVAEVRSCGDGIVIVDDEVLELEIPLVNAPPYLGYLLLENSAYHTDELRHHLGLVHVRSVDLSSLSKGLIVGTDGMKPLLSEDLHHPALAEPRLLQRWLNVQTSECIQAGTFRPGKCHDDVTLVIIRTDETQATLVEARREVTELKQRVGQLQQDVAQISDEAKRNRIGRTEAEARLDTLNKELKTLKVKAEEADVLAAQITALQKIVDTMRQGNVATSAPLFGLLQEFMKMWAPPANLVFPAPPARPAVQSVPGKSYRVPVKVRS